MKPCPHCPFRLNVKPYLRPDRAEEIADSLRSGADFPCHETLDYDDDGEGRRKRGSKFCAGALGVFYNEDDEHCGMVNQMVRIETRIGTLTEKDVMEPWNGLVYDSFDDFDDAYEAHDAEQGD